MPDTIGEVSVKGGEVQWTIPNISSHTSVDQCQPSPSFTLSAYQWRFGIHANGMTEDETAGCIHLTILRRGCAPPQCADFTVGVKKADGTVEIKADRVWVFDEGTHSSWVMNEFLNRSELLRRRTDLAPSDVLTIICNLKMMDSFDSPAGLDRLSKDFKDLFLSKKDCDVSLKVKQETISAHKLILQARSPVFSAMMEADMEEKNTGIINIEDCEPEAFSEFLLYLYTGKLENISSNAFKLYRIAHKYDVKELQKACLLYIMSNLSAENVCDAIILALEFSNFDLKLRAGEIFIKHFREIISTAKWESLMRKNYRVANWLLQTMARREKQGK